MTGFDAETTLELLRLAAAGDEQARERAWLRIYPEVLRIASAMRRRWSGDWTLETRALVNEVFIKVYTGAPKSADTRRQFFALLSKASRDVLVNHAEARSTVKRGANAPHVPIDTALEVSIPAEVSAEILDLHAALERFEQIDPAAAEIVELRFFGGLTYREVAETLGKAKITVEREWDSAKAWLNRELTESSAVDRLTSVDERDRTEEP